MRIRIVLLGILVIGTMACKQAATPSPAPTATARRPTPSPAPTVDPAELWYLLRGDKKADQAWGVDVDSAGHVYLGAFEQKPGQLFTDMSIYKFTLDGQEVWHTIWGGRFQEKAFIVAVAEPYVYVGGLTHTSMSLTEADMAVLALDAGSGKVLWEFTWGQGFGYEEVDGLIVEDDAIYVSGWTTSEKTGYDIGVLKLDRQGNKVWESVWGTEGFDSADGQMVVTEDSIYVSGRVNGANMFAGGQAVVVRFAKETGAYLQHATWGQAAFVDGFGMTSDGTWLYVVGITLKLGKGNQVFLLKYDPELNLQWDRIWGDESGEHMARAAGVDGSGNVLLGVNSRTASGTPTDICALKFSPGGDLLWESCWGGGDEDVVHGLVVDGEYVYLAGEIKFLKQVESDALLIKMDSRAGQFPPF